MKNTANISGFSIIEVLVGIFIFTLGLISIYLIMVSSLKLNDYNKNEIIASNLAREQIELMRNVRDSNYSTLHAWDWIPNGSDDSDPKFQAGIFYQIENNLNATEYPVSITEIGSTVPQGEANLTAMDIYRLCLDSNNANPAYKNIYTFDCSGSNEKTPFYRYVKIEDVGISGAIKVISKVIWYKRGYHELEINTILADWKRL